tara:strand:+ start:6538 stop:7896 length:1359 start_codon:yes stop_codon:yes gene_type:complete
MTIDILYNSHGENLVLYAIILDKSLNSYSPESNSFINSSNIYLSMIPLVGEKFNSYSASVDSSSFSTGSYIIQIYQREINNDNRGSTERSLEEEEDCSCWIGPGGPGSYDDDGPWEQLDGVDSAEMCYEIGGEWRCGSGPTNEDHNNCRRVAKQFHDECMEAVPDSWWDKLTPTFEDAWKKCRCEEVMRMLKCELLNPHCDEECFCRYWKKAWAYLNGPHNGCNVYLGIWPDTIEPIYDELYRLRPTDCGIDHEQMTSLINDGSITFKSASFPDIVTTTLLHVSEFNWDAQLQREVDSLDSKYYLPELLSYDVDQIYIIKVDSDAFYINDKKQPTINLKRGGTYRFDQSHSTNTGDHQFRISTSADGIHNGGIEYSSGVLYSSDSGTLRSYTTFEVPADAPSKLYYYCKNNINMGGVIEITGGNINDFGNNNIEIITRRGPSDDDGINIITR